MPEEIFYYIIEWNNGFFYVQSSRKILEIKIDVWYIRHTKGTTDRRFVLNVVN